MINKALHVVETTSLTVLDTNIILHDAQNLLTLASDGSTIVLPDVVIDELDAKKSGLTEVAYQAREFGRLLATAERVAISRDETRILMYLTIDDVNIIVVSLSDYNVGDADAKVINDRKIIAVAKDMLSLQPNTTFVTLDIMCSLRAEAYGIPIQEFKLVEQTSSEFVKHLTVDDDTFTVVHGADIREVDPEYLPENFNYVLSNSIGQKKLATVFNNAITVIGKETERELRKQDVNPKNAEQLLFSKVLQDDRVNIVVCEALSGSGKSISAISNAIKLVKQRKYSSIVYFRASVDDLDSEETIGYLSGNDEKFAPYLAPLNDSLDFIARNRHKDSKVKGKQLEEKVAETIESITEKCNIQAMIGLGLRGRTFDDCVFIIDEAQNQTAASLQKVLTRIGKNCKVIIIGSNRQIDHKWITRYTNGLSKVLEDCKKGSQELNLHAVTLHKVERGPVAEWAEKLFSKQQ